MMLEVAKTIELKRSLLARSCSAVASRCGAVAPDHQIKSGQQNQVEQRGRNKSQKPGAHAVVDLGLARLQQLVLAAFHGRDGAAKLVHFGFAPAGQNFAPRDLQAAVAPQGDGFFEREQSLPDLFVERVQLAFDGGVYDQITQNFLALADARNGGSVRFEISLLPGDDVAALPGFGVLHCG